MSSIKVMQTLNAQMVQLQADMNKLKTSVHGVDLLAASAAPTASVQGLDRTEVVAISEKVVRSAVAAVKSDCATVAKVEAGVTVRSMIPSIKADCVNVAKAVVGSGDELTGLKRDLEGLTTLQSELRDLKDSQQILSDKIDRLSLPKKAPARKTGAKESNEKVIV